MQKIKPNETKAWCSDHVCHSTRKWIGAIPQLPRPAQDKSVNYYTLWSVYNYKHNYMHDTNQHLTQQDSQRKEILTNRSVLSADKYLSSHDNKSKHKFLDLNSCQHAQITANVFVVTVKCQTKDFTSEMRTTLNKDEMYTGKAETKPGILDRGVKVRVAHSIGGLRHHPHNFLSKFNVEICVLWQID